MEIQSWEDWSSSSGNSAIGIQCSKQQLVVEIIGPLLGVLEGKPESQVTGKVTCQAL